MAWDVVLLFEPCKEPPFYLEAVFCTFTVCSALWAAHLRAGPGRGWRTTATVIFNSLYDLSALVLAVLIAGMASLFFLPAYQCYTPRAKFGEILSSASSSRDEINRRFSSSTTLHNIGAGLQILAKGRVKGGFVTPDGVIMVTGEDPSVVVILVPKPLENTLEWRCFAFPKNYLPTACKN